MSARVFSLYTGEEVGPATLDAMRFRARQDKWKRDAELLRQVDEYCAAYGFAWAWILDEQGES